MHDQMCWLTHHTVNESTLHANCRHVYFILCLTYLQTSVDNGLGSYNNVVTVDQNHFDAYYEKWDMLEKGVYL